MFAPNRAPIIDIDVDVAPPALLHFPSSGLSSALHRAGFWGVIRGNKDTRRWSETSLVAYEDIQVLYLYVCGIWPQYVEIAGAADQLG